MSHSFLVWPLFATVGAVLLAACAASSSAPSSGAQSVRPEPFGALPDGSRIDAYTLRTPTGVEVRVSTYGALLLSVRTPDRTGTVADVTLGYDTLADYVADSTTYFGALVGRYANRIARGRFTLDGQTYTLAVNDGPNHLHGGVRGFNKVVWEAEPFERAGERGVVLTYTSPDGDEGYPGTLRAHVTYTLLDDNRLVVDYRATTDRATPVNLTQHTYWNLTGDPAQTILRHTLTVHADAFTPTDVTQIPTGEIRPVAGTPFDFTRPTPLGDRIDADGPELAGAGGYDHNFVLRAATPGPPRLAARLYAPRSGRTLDVRTTEPGLQVYTGNMLDGTTVGRGGVAYGRHAGMALETQHFPDSPNHPDFPSAILRPGETYRSQTVYRFSTDAEAPPR